VGGRKVIRCIGITYDRRFRFIPSPEPDRKRSHRDMLANITLPNVEEMTLDREARLLAPCNIDQFHTRSQRATARSTVAAVGETSNHR